MARAGSKAVFVRITQVPGFARLAGEDTCPAPT
jgi:hypothetical protein